MQNGKYTAILIDDESWTREVLKAIGEWEELGIEIIAEASDGDFGLKLITSMCPDIIISDVKMPNMDGIALAKALQERRNQAKLLFVSGYDDYQLVRSAFRYNANDYLLKPVKPEELNKQLERCIAELAEEQKNKDSQSVQSGQEIHLERITSGNWLSAYMDIRGMLIEALRALNSELVSKRFDQISAIFRDQENEETARETVIYVYFDLNGILHRFILDQGISFSEIKETAGNGYVFGNATSMIDMLVYMKGLYIRSIDYSEVLRKEKNRLDISEIRRYIETNYATGITLEETAERFYVSKEYLSKVFKSTTGKGFSAYLTELRMEKAKQLLVVEHMPIKDIAEILGYREIGHFYRVFKKYYGLTPGEMQTNI